jgi:hypothetical protein
MNKARSVNKGWEFVSKGTEISLEKFVPEYFTPLTLDLQTGVVSTEADMGDDEGGSDSTVLRRSVLQMPFIVKELTIGGRLHVTVLVQNLGDNVVDFKQSL